MQKESHLNILIVEDVPSDAELAEYELRRAGLVFDSMRVDTEEAFLEALKSFRPNVIVSDYAMPRFDGMRALKIVQAHDAIMPFILLTGSINEEVAVECMKAGASDYVLKDRIKRLPFAVRESLERMKVRREKEEAEEALRANEELLSAIVETAKDSIFIKDALLRYIKVNAAMASLFGIAKEDMLGKTSSELFDPEVAAHLDKVDKRVLAGESTDEIISTPVQGEIRHLHTIKVPLKDAHGQIGGVCGIARDITEQRLADQAILRQLAELKQWHEITLGREDRIGELKREVNELLKTQGKPIKYASQSEEAGT